MKTLSAFALAASLALGSAIALAPLAPAMAATTKPTTTKTATMKKPACTPSKDKKCETHKKVAKHHVKKTPVVKTSAKKTDTATPAKPVTK
jgi:hypothetical protein